MPRNMKLTYLTFCPGVTKQVWLADADTDVYPKGHVAHFKNGTAGITFACGVANVIMDPANRSEFPHPVKGAHVIKTAAYIITGELHGILTVIKYAHSYGAIIDMNDDKTVINKIQNNPQEFEQEILLRAPSKVKRNFKPYVKKTNSGLRKAFFPRGAMARAINAGLITPQEAMKQAQKQQDAYEFKRTMSAAYNKK